MNAKELFEVLQKAGTILEPRLKIEHCPEHLMAEVAKHKLDLLRLLLSDSSDKPKSSDFKPFAKFGPVPSEGWARYWEKRGRLPKDLTREELERLADREAEAN